MKMQCFYVVRLHYTIWKCRVFTLYVWKCSVRYENTPKIRRKYVENGDTLLVIRYTLSILYAVLRYIYVIRCTLTFFYVVCTPFFVREEGLTCNSPATLLKIHGFSIWISSIFHHILLFSVYLRTWIGLVRHPGWLSVQHSGPTTSVGRFEISRCTYVYVNPPPNLAT